MVCRLHVACGVSSDDSSWMSETRSRPPALPSRDPGESCIHPFESRSHADVYQFCPGMLIGLEGVAYEHVRGEGSVVVWSWPGSEGEMRRDVCRRW